MIRPLHILSRIALPTVACCALLAPVSAVVPEDLVETAAKDENATLQKLLFPEGSGFSITSLKVAPATESSVTEWTITGYANEKSIKRLSRINTREGITGVFQQVAKSTGNPDFFKPTETLVVNVRTLENPGYKPGSTEPAASPFTFTMTITRRPVRP